MRNLHLDIKRGVPDIAFTFSLVMLLTAYFSLSFSVMIAPLRFSNHLTALITEYRDPNCVLCPFSFLSLHSVSLVARGSQKSSSALQI